MTKTEERYRAIAAHYAKHPIEDTRAHFGVSERTVYNAVKWCEENPAQLVQAAQLVQVAELDERADGNDPKFPDQMPGDTIARDGTNWRCPFWGELVPVVPGTRRDAWLEERKRLHHVAQNVTPESAAPDSAAPAAKTGSTAAPAATANLQSGTSTRSATANLQFCSATLDPAFTASAVPTRAPDPVVIERVIVRGSVARRGLLPVALGKLRDNYHVAIGIVGGLILVLWCW